MQFQRLDAVRGFAASYVFVGHVALAGDSHGLWTVPLRFGQEAVIVFFVLSGFVIQWAHQDLRGQLGRYFAKRFLRIYVVWFAAVLAMGAIVSYQEGELSIPSAESLVGNGLMLQDIASLKPAVVVAPLYGDLPLWSLHYEWWFYVLFPIVCMLPESRKSHIVGIGACAAACIYAVAPNVLCRLLMYFAIWWIGAHAANVLRSKRAIHLKDLAVPILYCACAALPLAADAATRAATGARLGFGVHPILEPRHLLSGCTIVLMAFAWRRLRWVGFKWLVGPFSIVAPISYSLYILHYISVANADYLSAIPRAVQIPVYTIATIVYCYLIEVKLYTSVRRRVLNPSR